MSDTEDTYGPVLPISSINKCNSGTNSPILIGPIPPHNPNDIEKQPSTNDISKPIATNPRQNFVHNPETSTNNSTVGPALPPQLIKQTTDSKTVHQEACGSYGPALPPSLQDKLSQKTSGSSDEDEDAYGPLPPGVASNSTALIALEERALQIKLGLLEKNDDTNPVREEWMLELPEVRSGSLGLGARQFRKNNRPDFSDRSSWTDSPLDKVNKRLGKVDSKVDLKKEAELREIRQRDEEHEEIIEKHNKKKKRDKSLMEMHQDTLKKKQKTEKGETSVRRPFNREIDLKVNQFDDAQKKSILKKAQLLDDRFSRGQSKFL